MKDSLSGGSTRGRALARHTSSVLKRAFGIPRSPRYNGWSKASSSRRRKQISSTGQPDVGLLTCPTRYHPRSSSPWLSTD